MAFKLAEAFVRVFVKNEAERQLDGIHGRLRNVHASFMALSGLAAGTFAVSAAALGGFVKMASDAEESASKFQAVFKDQARAAREFADDLSKRINRSSLTIMDFMSRLQDTFVPMGIARDKARQLSGQVASLAFDLASFNNTSEPETVDRLTSALVGNHEAVRSFGVVINEATLNQKLLAQGFKATTQGATEQQKLLARLALILEGTADAHGDAERTAGGFANTIRGLQGSLSELAVGIGSTLLPTLNELADRARNTTEAINDMDEGSKRNLGTWLAWTAGAAGTLVVLPKVVAGVKAVGAVLAVLTGTTAGAFVFAAGGVIVALKAIFGETDALGQSLLRLYNPLLKLTGGFIGFQHALEKLDNIQAIDTQTRGILQGIEKTLGTDKAPAAIEAGVKALQEQQKRLVEARNKIMDQAWSRHATVSSAFGLTSSELTAAEKANIAELEASGKLIESNINRLQQQLDVEKKITSEIKEQKKQSEIPDKRFERVAGITRQQMGSLPGMGFLGAVDPSRAAFGLGSLSRKKERDEQDKKLQDFINREWSDALSRDSRRSRGVRKFDDKQKGALEEALLTDMFGGKGEGGFMGKFMELSKKVKDEEEAAKKQPRSLQYMGVDQLSRNVQESVKLNIEKEILKKQTTAAESLVKLEQEGIKIKNLDELKMLGTYG